MNTKKRGMHTSVKEIVIANTGMTESGLLNDLTEYTLKKTKDFYKIVNRYDKVKICGDYDVDGIMASAIMQKLMKYLGKDVSIRLPRRFSEGFGLSTKAIDETDEGLIITVDNGVSANEAVSRAKEKGLGVIITDHHLSDDIPADADLVIDPMAIKKSSTFNGYCGAGVAYKIASEVVKDEALLNEMLIFAAIATIADSVPLIYDNRVIVKKGFEAIANGYSPIGLKALYDVINVDAQHLVTDDIGYKIASTLNAPGRLFDDGAEKSLELLLCEDEDKAKELAIELDFDNKTRQGLVSEAIKTVEASIQEGNLMYKCPIIVEDDIQDGIVGIIAGKVCEKYKVPAIIVTKTDKGYKGSARGPKGFHIKNDLDEIYKREPNIFLSYGGHERAAGMTVAAELFDEFKNYYENLYSTYTPKVQEVVYDLQITEAQIEDTLKELDSFGPYGEGNPLPIFLIKNFVLTPNKKGETFKTLGAEGKTLKLMGQNFTATSFDGAEYYKSIGCPERLDIIGSLSHNYWNGWDFKQMTLLDFDASEKSTSETLEAYIRTQFENMSTKK